MTPDINPNDAVEMSLLGCFIIGRQEQVIEHRPLLRRDAFFVPAHGIIAECIGQMLDEGTAIELLTLKQFMSSRKEAGDSLLGLAGGEDYLIAIAEEVHSTANVDHYAKLVRDRWQRRRILASARKLAETAKDPDASISEVIAEATSVSSEAAALVPKKVFTHISEIDLTQDKTPAVPTGILGVDAQISTGGFTAGQMSVIRAYHKGGKSGLMIQCALNAAQEDKRVLYATFADLHRRHIKARIMRMFTGFLRQPEDESLFGTWNESLDTVNALPLDIYDVSETDDGGTVEEFSAWAQSQIKTSGGWDIIFVDYAQELISGSRQVHGMMEAQMECARVLNRLASRTKIPVVVGSQITRGITGSVATKWGRDWEEKAGLVLTLDQPDPTGDNTRYQLEITYSRFGPQGPRANPIRLRFNQTLLCMEEMDY